MEDMIETFKQVKINLPLIEAIRQVPSYAKFLKDLCTQKRKSNTNVTQKVLLAECVSSVFHTSTPPKLPDPGTPTISCIIGDHLIERALLDLGASVNLMPYSVYEKFGLGELKPTSITLQLADRSVRTPRGVIEDVLVKVDQFFFPADFIVLDTELGQTSKQTTPIILGRPFLATANANIHVRAGVMDVSFGNMNVKLNIYNSSRHAQSEEDCFAVNVLDSLVEDPLQACLDHFGFEEFDIDKSIEKVNTLLDSTHFMDISSWANQVEPTPSLMGASVTSSVGILLKSDLEPLSLESIVPCVDSIDTIMINQGEVDYVQSWEVGGTCIEDENHCTKG